MTSYLGCSGFGEVSSDVTDTELLEVSINSSSFGVFSLTILSISIPMFWLPSILSILD